MKKFAVLDSSNRLVGVTEGEEGQIELSADFDLPTDGTHQWNGRFFEQVASARVGRPPEPSPLPRVLRCLIEAVDDSAIDLPIECAEWADWYDQKHEGEEDHAAA